MYIYYRFIDDAAARYEGIELVTASNCDDLHIIWYFLKHIIYAFTNYNVYLSIIGLSMMLQHTAMEGTANWAQMTWTSFRLRYVFFYIYSF